MLLAELLDDRTIGQLQIPSEKLTELYFQAIQQAHRSANKCYKRVSIHMLLKALSALVHNNAIQIVIAKSSTYFEYLISISDDYNIIYDILWTLSFNPKFHEQFHSQKSFLSRIRTFVDQLKSALDKDVFRVVDGILWNLVNRDKAIALANQSEKNTQQTTTNTDK